MNYTIKDLRTSIDNIDEAVLLLLSERFRVTQKVGELKRQNDNQAVDPVREREMFTKLIKSASDKGLDPELVEKIWRLIVCKVVENHKSLRQKEINDVN
ncbi:chorismate mutase [Candidatus Saccharibacteria bacterium]|nr:chorismate mutase [Candidatus Saccharibacteria bacterium]